MNKTRPVSNTDLQLIKAVRKGDKKAENTLFMNHYKFMKKTHDFGPDGIYSHSKKSLCNKFEDMLADIYEIFMKCVKTYNPAIGSFQTHLGFRMQMAAKDRIRNKLKEKKITISPSTMVHISDGEESIHNDENSLFDKMTAPWLARLNSESRIHDRSFEIIDKIVDEFGEDSIEVRYIELYCSLGCDEKKHTNEICEKLGCSRQTLTNIKKRIKAKFNDANDLIPLRFEDAGKLNGAIESCGIEDDSES